MLLPVSAFLADSLYPALLVDLKVYYIVFGLVMILGGVMGYVKARSVPSLVAGGISGLLLIVGAFMLTSPGWYTGLVVELLVSLALLGRFLPSLLRAKYNPAAYVVPLALIGAVLAILLLTRIIVVHV